MPIGDSILPVPLGKRAAHDDFQQDTRRIGTREAAAGDERDAGRAEVAWRRRTERDGCPEAIRAESDDLRRTPRCRSVPARRAAASTRRPPRARPESPQSRRTRGRRIEPESSAPGYVADGSARRKLMAPAGSKPGCTDRRRHTLLAMSPDPTSTTSASATCETTRACRARWRCRPAVVERFVELRTDDIDAAPERNAGSAADEERRQSSNECRDAEDSRVDVDFREPRDVDRARRAFASASHAGDGDQHAKSAARGGDEKSLREKLQENRARNRRRAPAGRRARSGDLRPARETGFATLAHAMASTKPAAPKTTHNTRPMSPTTTAASGRTDDAHVCLLDRGPRQSARELVRQTQQERL